MMDSHLQPARVDPRKQALLEARFFGGAKANSVGGGGIPDGATNQSSQPTLCVPMDNLGVHNDVLYNSGSASNPCPNSSGGVGGVATVPHNTFHQTVNLAPPQQQQPQVLPQPPRQPVSTSPYIMPNNSHSPAEVDGNGAAPPLPLQPSSPADKPNRPTSLTPQRPKGGDGAPGSGSKRPRKGSGGANSKQQKHLRQQQKLQQQQQAKLGDNNVSASIIHDSFFPSFSSVTNLISSRWRHRK